MCFHSISISPGPHFGNCNCCKGGCQFIEFIELINITSGEDDVGCPIFECPDSTL